MIPAPRKDSLDLASSAVHAAIHAAVEAYDLTCPELMRILARSMSWWTDPELWDEVLPAPACGSKPVLASTAEEAASFLAGKLQRQQSLPRWTAMNMTLTADESAAFLAGKLRRQEPFSFWRFGDGLIELAIGKQGATCDGEKYTVNLAKNMLACWKSVLHGDDNTYLGNWLSASFDGPSDPSRYRTQWGNLLDGARPQFLHFEALLLMRESAALLDFYRAVQDDPRRKLFMGPAGNAGAAEWLGAEFLPTSMRDLHVYANELEAALKSRDWDVLLYGAGMAGVIPVCKAWQQFPERTYVSLGSAMDPLFRGKSRKQQLSRERARALFGFHA